MNRQIRRVGVALMALFVLLFINLNWLQVVQAKKLANDPRNTRVAVRDFSQARGQVISADGAVLAKSVPSGDAFKLQRQYPEGDLFAPVTGFFSFTYGATGIERTYGDELAGRDLGIRNLKDVLIKRTNTGDVVLTVDKRLQTLARDQLGNRKGAVVVVEPTSGNLLALWSYPSFDPNNLAAHDSKSVQTAYGLYSANADKPLLARAYRETYPPGSTFKVITSSAAFERNPDLTTKVYPQLRELTLPGTKRTLPNFGGESCGGTIADLLRVSCNTGFGQMGLDLGADALVGEAKDFGFDEKPPIDLPAAATSFIPDAGAFAHDLPALAKSAIGQQDVRATPLQMAMVAAAVDNGGVAMKPHLLAQLKDNDGNTIRSYDPQQWKQATNPQTASSVHDLMLNVVAAGTGTAARIPGAVVGGKTGTAQTTGDAAHAWFIGFADANGKKVAVAVVVESQPGVSEATGGRVAAPIAGAMMKAALGL